MLCALLFFLQAPDLAPGQKTTDKHLGFELALPKNSAEIPVRRTVGDVLPALSWYESQAARGWVVQSGGKDPSERLRVILGELKIRRGESKPLDDDPATKWDDDVVAGWIASFSEMETDGDPFEQPMDGFKAKGWRLASETRAGFAFVITRKDSVWLLLYKFPKAWDARDAVLASAKTMKLTAPASAPAREFKAGKAPEMTAARKETLARVQRDLAGHTAWGYLQTEHYIVESNLDEKAQKALIESLGANLERVHEAYRTLFPPAKPVDAVSVVKVFSHRDQLFAHFSERKPDGLNLGVIGMWMPAYDELVIFHDPTSSNAASTNAILYHEGFHQYIHYAYGGVDLPRWFDEGTGDYFGGAQPDADGVKIGENASRAGTITKIVNGEFTKQYGWNPPALADLLQMDRDAFYRETKWLVFQYTMAWSVIYYLAQGIEKDSPYAGALERYASTLRETQSAAKAYEAAFSKVDAAAFEKDWKAFWLSPDARKKADGRRVVTRKK